METVFNEYIPTALCRGSYIMNCVTISYLIDPEDGGCDNVEGTGGAAD